MSPLTNVSELRPIVTAQGSSSRRLEACLTSAVGITPRARLGNRLVFIGTLSAAFASGSKVSILRAIFSVRSPEILLKHGAVLIDHKGHDAGIAVFGGISNERKAADHLTLDEIVVSPTGSGRALPREDAVVIAMIGYRGAAGLVALGCSLRSEIAKRARLLSFCGWPVESVLLSRTTDDPLRIDTSAKTRRIKRGIFILRLDISESTPGWRKARCGRCAGARFHRVRPWYRTAIDLLC